MIFRSYISQLPVDLVKSSYYYDNIGLNVTFVAF